ncbi:MAG TPA: UdgX family uracil-DNA binding protein [Polyangiaceae bacterium]|jgi:DNA polymerase|nr:UdgX family uracil-DNA binding protein [Polyangiaceae bacterium]
MATTRKPTHEAGAERFLPAHISLKNLQESAKSCEGCPLYLHATQTVFGEGPKAARVVFVGEQPGDAEDRAGRPFVGPAGKILDRALAAAGIARADSYVTNAVKHFKFEQRGKARLHKRPKAGEIGACSPWLHAELRVIRPDILVLLGATAGQALFGPSFRVGASRGKKLPSEWAKFVLATVHPSSILRAPSPEERERAFEEFVADLKLVARELARSH